MNNKKKVVFLCHFSNESVRDSLGLSGNSLLSWIRKKTNHELKDYAPWVTEFINEFKKCDTYEFHIVAPHPGLKRSIVAYESDGIFYHFYTPFDSPIVRSIKKQILKQKENYRLVRQRVSEIISGICPKIVCLCGAENPYYSIAALDVKDCPLYVILQTVLNNPNLKKYNRKFDFRADIEKQVFERADYFGTEDKLYYNILKEIKPKAAILKTTFAWHRPKIKTRPSKEYDFVFYAQRLVKYKGIEDVLHAFVILHAKYPKASLNVIGSCEPQYMTYLQSIIEENSTYEKVTFNGYFPKHDDALLQVMKSSCVVVPGITASINNTILEPMFLGLPVIAYVTSGTPYLNREKECIILAENSNVQDLTAKMEFALNNPDKMAEVANNGASFVNEHFSNEASGRRLINCLSAAIGNYYSGIDIPNNLFFDVNDESNF